MDPWPFGVALRRARENVAFVNGDGKRGVRKMSIREAARLANLSEARWRQLEGGIQYVAGEAKPTSTTAPTAATAARVVGLDVAEALRLAGFDPAAYGDLDNLGGEAQSDRIPGASRLTPRQRTKIIELVQAILETDDEPTGVRGAVAPADIATRGTVLGRSGDDSDDAGTATNA